MTNPSSLCASAIASISSAIISRVGRIYCIPLWLIATPSQAPIVPISTGVPPAAYIPSFTLCVNCFNTTCPGQTWLYALTTAIIGFFNSSSVKPDDLYNALTFAHSAPFKISLLLFIFLPSSFCNHIIMSYDVLNYKSLYVYFQLVFSQKMHFIFYEIYTKKD